MDAIDVNAVPVFSQSQDSRQQQFRSLISVLGAPQGNRANSDACRLLVERRVFWALEPVDANMSWMVLPEPVQVRRLAGCLVLTVD